MPRGRKAGRRGESGVLPRQHDGRRSHRAAARPCAALPWRWQNGDNVSRPLEFDEERKKSFEFLCPVCVIFRLLRPAVRAPFASRC